MCNKNVILFPGLGSQYNDMAKKLLCVPKCKKIFMYASEIINCDLISLLESEVNNLKAKIMQPLLLTYGIASYIMLKDYLEFKIFLGHSLGELVALTAAGYINFEEALLFSVERGKYYDNALEKGEVAVVIGIEKNALEDIIDQIFDPIYITAYNTKSQFLVAGSGNGIRELEKKIKGTEVIFIPYSMLPQRKNVPVHCELMKTQNKESLIFSGKIEINSNIVFSSITGKHYVTPDEVVDNLKKQIYLPVLWSVAMENLFRMEPNIIVDAGPQRVLKDFALELADDKYKKHILVADLANDLEQIKRKKVE